MSSIGVDIAKGKNTICAIKPYGEILVSPKDHKQLAKDFFISIFNPLEMKRYRCQGIRNSKKIVLIH